MNTPSPIEAIFFAALEKDSPAELATYLDEACAGNSDLRERVERMLAAQVNAGSFLEVPVGEIDRTITQPITEKPGTVIGPYKLLQQIGEGGMGVVYMADQTEPVERRVALKIIKPGMDTKQVIARFEAERQALAMMDHPNIAKVLDAGTTDSGRPYFVMELVKGVPITEYCDEHQMSPKERLELFIPVCQAVQHAHQKGIIHRDIKPSNVMIAEYDDRPVPKIIDFGVAKAIEQRLTEKTAFTQFGQVVGTVDYMSPEQAKLNQFDIDTRSDIYSLGVLLYELLTGETPLDRERLRGAAFDEMLRIIREEEPPKPSMRLSSSHSLPSIAANRHVEPKKLSTLVRGELDWIVMKALEKDRTRRYETANGFAADIDRYLQDEPVVACPPSATYRFRKFARRNKAALGTAAVVAVALLMGIAGTTWQAIRATDAVVAERRAHEKADRAWEAEASQRTVAEQERDRAVRAEARAEANFTKARETVDHFLIHVSEDQLLRAPGLQPLRRELLTLALDYYTDFASARGDDVGLQAELANAEYQTGQVLRELGDRDAADEANLQAIASYKALVSGGHDAPAVPSGLAKASYAAGRYEDVVAQCRAILESGDNAVEVRRLLAMAYNRLANANGDIERALELHQEAVDIRKNLISEHPSNVTFRNDLASTLNNLGVCLERSDSKLNALAMYQQAFELAEAVSAEPQEIAYARSLAIYLRNAARMHQKFHHSDDALRSYEEVVAIRRKLAFNNPALPELKGELWQAYCDLGAYQRTLRLEDDTKHSFQAAADVLDNMPRKSSRDLFNLAVVYGTLAQTTKERQEPETEEEAAQRDGFAELGVEALCDALDAGFADVKSIRRLPTLAPIRGHEKYEEVIGDVENYVVRIAETTMAEYRKGDENEGAGWDPRAVRAAIAHAAGTVRMNTDQYGNARELLLEAADLRTELLVEHPEDEQVLYNFAATQLALAELYSHEGQTDQAIALVSKAIARAPRDAHLRLFMAHCSGRQGDWRNAAAYYGEAAERLPNSGFWNSVHAGSLLLAGDEERYRDCCVDLFERFQDSVFVDYRCHVARACTLGANSGVRPDHLVQFAERIVETKPQSPWFLHTLGMAYYRAGQLDEAADQFNKSLTLGGGGQVLSWLSLAIVEHRRDNPEEAARWLQKAEEWIDKNRKKPDANPEAMDVLPKLNGGAHVACYVLQREAEALIKGKNE